MTPIHFTTSPYFPVDSTPGTTPVPHIAGVSFRPSLSENPPGVGAAPDLRRVGRTVDDETADQSQIWPPTPVHVDGTLEVKLLGLEIAQIRLDVTIRAASWIIEQVGVVVDSHRDERRNS